MQRKPIGHVCDTKVQVLLVTPEPGGRGRASVELTVWGARYPYKLSVAEARDLAAALTAAADELEDAIETRGQPS